MSRWRARRPRAQGALRSPSALGFCQCRLPWHPGTRVLPCGRHLGACTEGSGFDVPDTRRVGPTSPSQVLSTFLGRRSSEKPPFPVQGWLSWFSARELTQWYLCHTRTEKPSAWLLWASPHPEPSVVSGVAFPWAEAPAAGGTGPSQRGFLVQAK